jgi:hypothetical protein
MCPVLYATCEYGSDPNPSCNQLFQCQSTGWQPENGSCPGGGTCPASYSAVAQNQACMPEGLDCAYSEGQCNCTYTLPVGGGPYWKCFTPAGGCPDPRPRIGSACSAPSTLSCDYGACAGGIELQCADGYWKEEAVPCPG